MISPDFERGYRAGWLDYRLARRLVTAWTDGTVYGAGYRAGQVDAEHTPYGARTWRDGLTRRARRKEAA